MLGILRYLFGYCEDCRHWFVYPRTRRRNTQYHNDEDNYVRNCKVCFDRQEEYWADMWAEYYGGLL